MEVTEKNIKRWATIGARPTLGQALMEIASLDEELMVLTADVSTSAGLERFKRKYPDKYLDVGIAEQNMMGIATGLAAQGFHVVTTTFAPFQSMRCLEQIRVYQGYMRMPLVMIGLASGIYHSYLGNTHCCFEDAALLRSIPNINVVTPADCTEIVKALNAALKLNEPVYIRLIEGAGIEPVYSSDYNFEIGKAVTLREGTDAAIIANGRMVHLALETADALSQKSISAKVINMHTVKPIDTNVLDEISEMDYLITIEEHNVVGGLGSAVAEYLMRKKEKPVQIMCGINDYFPHATDYESALSQAELTIDGIVNKILNAMGEE
ncbi:MAG: transketolase [Lachnoclostridium sp.]|nr:transketolase [Lachnospira sp.]MCM1247301.1 transketolase [Lachnoclostridium sp.]MCM1534397.1 transketolase [Clostridium sp.]